MEELSQHHPITFVFGPFVLVPERQMLLRSNTPVRIGGRALDILTALVERPGELVSKGELIARVWPDVIVEEGNLKVNIAALRRALGDGPDAATYIATVVGRGYRFIAPVQSQGTSALVFTASPPALRKHNLPVSTTHIFGRSVTIAAIERHLSESRLVSIVGAGGIGKTTVALALAERAVPEYRDGVWLIDLSPLKEPALLPSAIATAVGLTAHSANTLAALCEYLQDRNMLVVLDSCEHMIGHAARCADSIQAAAADVKILVTSREPLGVRGERVLRINGLDAPPASPHLDAKEALTFSAVQLFVHRATDRLETFTLTDADAHAVAEICRKLDGLALAIELAATRVDAFSVHGILNQLDDRFRLTMAQRAGPDRHRTLTATIDWSYEILSDNERTLMRRLSTFAGGFDLDSACAVATDDRIGRIQVVEGLASLVAKSLVAAEIRDSEVDYRLWDTTRSYAMEKLAAGGELSSARLRHTEHFLALAEQAAAAGDRLARAEWLARYADRLDDIRNALSWAFADANAPAIGVSLTVAAVPFWRRLSLVDECRAAVQRALEDRFKTYRSASHELILQQSLGATLLHIRGPVPEAKRALEAALEIAQSLGDPELELECLRGLAEYELWTGDMRSALAVSEKMRAMEAEKPELAGAADAQAGSALQWLGDLSTARLHLENVVNRPIAAKPHTDAARFEFDQRLFARGALTSVLWTLGFPDQALEQARLEYAEAEASQYAVSYCHAILHGSATLALLLRDYDTAERYIKLGEEHAAKHGLSVWLAMAAGGPRCRWQLYTGQRVDLEKLRKLLAMVLESGAHQGYPHFLTNYGEALARQGDPRGGLAAIDKAIALCEDTGQIVSEILRIKGNVIRFQDPAHSELAVECYRRAIDLAGRNGALAWELRAAISLVKLTRKLGGDKQAEAMLATAYGRFTEGFTSGDLRRARALLTVN